MKKEMRPTLYERRENISANRIFDFGGGATYTTTAHYAKLNIRIDSDVTLSEIVGKLDSLKDEPAVEYPSASEARYHLKKLKQK